LEGKKKRKRCIKKTGSMNAQSGEKKAESVAKGSEADKIRKEKKKKPKSV